MDKISTYQFPNDLKLAERKRRGFWSLQFLAMCYGQQPSTLLLADGTQSALAGSKSEDSAQFQVFKDVPAMPVNPLGTSTIDSTGLWDIFIQLAWIWNRARMYVRGCISDDIIEPWRAESPYVHILADLMIIEGRVPTCHRYQTVKFYEQDRASLQRDRHYWRPWLALQIMYHAAHTMLNHPFIYATASQRNEHVSQSNTFWTRSAQDVLLHASWIVRINDMILQQGLLLSDPIFAQAAAIAATVHLHYCSSPDPRLRQKSFSDLAKSKRFLQNLAETTPLSNILVRVTSELPRDKTN